MLWIRDSGRMLCLGPTRKGVGYSQVELISSLAHQHGHRSRISPAVKAEIDFWTLFSFVFQGQALKFEFSLSTNLKVSLIPRRSGGCSLPWFASLRLVTFYKPSVCTVLWFGLFCNVVFVLLH